MSSVVVTVTIKGIQIPKELDSIITGVITLYQDRKADNSQIVVYKDTLLDSMEKFVWCIEREMHVKSMGIHPSNRDGEGLNDVRANTRVQMISKPGFPLKP